jgi:3',5'-cyclic AMP phosphodiesterase CpdA
MAIRIIHISDVHFRERWEEDQGLVLNAFFKDLKQQIGRENNNVFVVFSGDVVLGGSQSVLYDKFLERFDREFLELNIPKEHRIVVPGNHDVSRDFIASRALEHTSLTSTSVSEKAFNDYIVSDPDLIIKKFENYLGFEQRFAEFGVGNSIGGRGHYLNANLGLYCLNTALYSSGGHNGINDHGRLCIDTRTLQKWVAETNHLTRILVMHHPLDWLTDWSQAELKKIMDNEFSLCFFGHVHEQDHYFKTNSLNTSVVCCAPPLFTSKKDKLGYSIVTIGQIGVEQIQYRQWTKNNMFLSGVDFSGTEDGKVLMLFRPDVTIDHHQAIARILEARLNDALKSYEGQPIIWADPTLSENIARPNVGEANENTLVPALEIVKKPTSLIIKAPPQFGLTCLARFLVKSAWISKKKLWLYLEYSDLKPNNIEKVIRRELEFSGYKLHDIECVILDSWTGMDRDAKKILSMLSKICGSDKALIVMHRIDDAQYNRSEATEEKVDRAFSVLHLLALTRAGLRGLVTDYNNERYIASDNVVVNKVVSDLDVLNIHRTALNCITLLKVSEKFFDESPVNRTKMLEMVLFLLFNADSSPTYESKLDVKDCEHVLGRFCEILIRDRQQIFSKETFLKEIGHYCEEKLIEIDVNLLWNTLYINNIIVGREPFWFRFSYWMHYFGAQRMHHDSTFAAYIFENKRYVSYPEIIEFYTGIDRRREDALKILTDDIRTICNTVHDKVGLPDGMNPYRLIAWNPTQEHIEKMQNEIGEDVRNSNLPDAVKDQHADQAYDPTKPYDQSIRTIMEDYSVSQLMQSIKACSRALRNSDHVGPEVKRELLNEILRSWEQLSKVFLALTPVLAVNGNAIFDGHTFYLFGDFGDNVETRIKIILENIPYNVVTLFKDDIYSGKIGPLLYDRGATEMNPLRKHELYLLLVYVRPKGWRQQLEMYIENTPKNSFYLYDMFHNLRMQYKMSFASPQELRDIEYLVKMCLAKHTFGDKKPSLDKIVKINSGILPKRDKDIDN